MAINIHSSDIPNLADPLPSKLVTAIIWLLPTAWACRFAGPVNEIPNRYKNLKRAYTTQWSEISHGITHTHHGNTASYKYFDFGQGNCDTQSFFARVRSWGTPWAINIRLDAADGPVAGTLSVPDKPGGQWRQYGTPLNEAVQGVHAIYLEFVGEPDTVLGDIESFQFQK